MKKSKPHPGPFFFVESLDGREYEIRTQETDLLVARVCKGMQTAQGNARLFAHAPAMLSTLKGCRPFLTATIEQAELAHEMGNPLSQGSLEIAHRCLEILDKLISTIEGNQ